MKVNPAWFPHRLDVEEEAKREGRAPMSDWPVRLAGLSCSNRNEEKWRSSRVWEDQEFTFGDAEFEISIRHLREMLSRQVCEMD